MKRLLAHVVAYVLCHAEKPRHVLYGFVGNYLLCSALFMVTERNTDAAPGPVSSLWWGIVTGSTVGYGDYSPVTTEGRGVAAFYIVASAVFMFLMAAHTTAYLLPNPHLFSDSEQKRVLGNLVRIVRLLVTLIREQRETQRLVRQNNEMLRSLCGLPLPSTPITERSHERNPA